MKGSRHVSTQRVVTFRDCVQIACIGEPQVGQFWATLDDVHLACRTFWHMDGQVCEHDTIFQVMSRWFDSPFPFAVLGGFPSALLLAQQCFWRAQPSESQFQKITQHICIKQHFEWGFIEEEVEKFPARARFFIETWFLSPNRVPLCLKSRRFILTRHSTQHDFQQRCLEVWADHLEPHGNVAIVQVSPKPESMMATVAHFLVIQHPQPTWNGVILRRQTMPLGDRNRALLTHSDDDVVTIFRRAQFDRACSPAFRPRYLDDKLTDQRYSNDQVPHLPAGRFVQGDILTWHADSDEERDDAISNGTTVTEVPDSDDDIAYESEEDRPSTSLGAYGLWVEGNSGLHQVTPNEASDGHAHMMSDVSDGMRTGHEAIPWHEIPLDFRVSDIFGDQQHSWEAHALTHDTSDSVSFMQRNRSRSRDERPPPADTPENAPEEDPDEGQESEPLVPESSLDDDLVTWHLLYSNMTEEGPDVQAGEQGPTIQQAQQAMGFPDNSIVAVHPVTALQQVGFEHIALVECREDHVYHLTESIVLTDAVVRDARAEQLFRGEPHLSHSWAVIRRRQSFHTYTGLTRLHPILLQFLERISVWHNGHRWEADDPALRTINTGDHLEIVFSEPLDQVYARLVMQWLLAEGLNPWPELIEVANGYEVSPTLPFVAQADEDPHMCTREEARPLQGFRGFCRISTTENANTAG